MTTTQTRDVDVARAAGTLRDHAISASSGSWEYTRETGIRHIRYAGDHAGYDHPLRRLARWAQPYLRPAGGDTWAARAGRKLAWRHPLIHLRTLTASRHLPDGAVNDGVVITHWEEDGEYLQLVQPAVGALLADILEAHPHLPEVQALAQELLDISSRYSQRVAHLHDHDSLDDDHDDEHDGLGDDGDGLGDGLGDCGTGT